MTTSSFSPGSIVQGNTGPQGVQGNDGLDGPKGATGATGANGTNSNAGLSALGTFSGKNQGALAAITMTSIAWDDGYSWSTGNTYVAIPFTGKYLITGTAGTSGQSGSGGGNVDVQHLDSGGTLIETIIVDQIPFNGQYAWAGMVSATANDRISLRTQNGATGSAGSVAGRFGIMRMS